MTAYMDNTFGRYVVFREKPGQIEHYVPFAFANDTAVRITWVHATVYENADGGRDAGLNGPRTDSFDAAPL
jgi:hypothetical protein